MFDDVMSLSEDGFNVERAIAEVGIPTTKPGDIIKLGNHVSYVVMQRRRMMWRN